MNLENYRSSNEYREILRILQKSTTLQENFLWQSHALGKTIIPIQHMEIDFVSREVVVSFDPERYRLEDELPLYVKLDYHYSVFKSTNYRQVHNTIHFAFPDLIKTQELRESPRHTFRPSHDRFVTLRSSMIGSMKDSNTELNVRVMDISESGLGVVISELNRSYLKNNRILWVTALQGHILEYPILAEVVYINNEVDPKFQIKKQKDLKVGLKLSGVFPEATYQQFLQ